MSCTVNQALVLLSLLLKGYILEAEWDGLPVNDQCDLVAELHSKPIGLQLLNKADHQAHVLVLEDDVGSTKLVLVFHAEGCTHGVAGRHDYGSQFLKVKRCVEVAICVFVENVDSLVNDGEDASNDPLVKDYHLIGEDESLVARQEVASEVFANNDGPLFLFFLFLIIATSH